MLEDLLPHYENELTILRKLSKDFARRYPKIAGRLMLEGEVCEDPHVERLIESFAFLAARIHRKLDDEFPEVTEALLSVLYPHFLRPVPSMSIAQLSAAPGAGVGSRQQVPRGTQLLSRPVNGMPVKYRTAYDVDSVRFVLPFVEQPQFAQIACETIVEIAHHREVRDPNKAEFDKALDKVIQLSKDPEVIDRAQKYKRGETWVRPKK